MSTTHDITLYPKDSTGKQQNYHHPPARSLCKLHSLLPHQTPCWIPGPAGLHPPPTGCRSTVHLLHMSLANQGLTPCPEGTLIGPQYTLLRQKQTRCSVNTSFITLGHYDWKWCSLFTFSNTNPTANTRYLHPKTVITQEFTWGICLDL